MWWWGDWSKGCGESAPSALWYVFIESRDRKPVISVRQIVASNLARGRSMRGLTQEELGDELSRVTGTPWSQATVSAAENGRKGVGRVRHFDVDELVAFALVLKLPVTWFLTPPSAEPEGSVINNEEQPWITTTKGRSGPVAAVDSQHLLPLLTIRFPKWEPKTSSDDQPKDTQVVASPDTTSSRRLDLIDQLERILEDMKRLEQQA
jgi:transcriptional regulator with XRE-family HTH domain